MNLDDIKIEQLHWERGYHLEDEEDDKIYCDITGEEVDNEYIVFQDVKVIKYEKDLVEQLRAISPFNNMEHKEDDEILELSWGAEYWYFEDK